MTRVRATLPLVVSAVAVSGLTACAGTSSGASAASSSSAPATSSGAGASTGSASSSAERSDPMLADGDYGRSRLCVLVPRAFAQSYQEVASWASGSGGDAGRIAQDLETAVSASQPVVEQAPQGPARSAGSALVSAADRLAQRLQGGGTATDAAEFQAAWTTLSHVCEVP